MAAPLNRGYEPSRVVHVRNLPENIDMDLVKDLGLTFGPVISVLKIKDTQAFLYMENLKDAEELVNEYRQHPPKIGWRTVFVQFSQYSRLDVSAKKPEPPESKRSKASSSSSSSDDRSRRRTRESRSKRSSSPESLSPPLPDISVPFYMLPRSEDSVTTEQFVSRPQLVSYPHLSKQSSGLVSYPNYQGSVSYPHLSSSLSRQDPTDADGVATSLENSTTLPASSESSVIVTSSIPPLMSLNPRSVPSLMSHPFPLTSASAAGPRTVEPSLSESDEYTGASFGRQWNDSSQYGQWENTENDRRAPWEAMENFRVVLEQVSSDLEALSHRMSAEEIRCSVRSQLDNLSRDDVIIVMCLERQYGQRCTPYIISMLHALSSLHPNIVGAIAKLEPAALEPVTRSQFANQSNLGSILHQLSRMLFARFNGTGERGDFSSVSDGNFWPSDENPPAADSFHLAKKKKVPTATLR